MAEKTEIIISAVDATKAAFASVQSGLGNLERSFGAFDGLAARLPILATGIAAVFGGTSIAGFVRDSVSAMAALDDMAEKTGASVESLSALSDVAKIGGHDLGLVETGAIRMAKALSGADDEAKGAGHALKALGLEADALKGMDSGQALKVVADRLNQFGDSAGKTALVMDIFGKSGAQLLPFLKDLAEKQQLVTKITAEQAAEAEKLEKAFGAIKVAGADMARTLAGPVVNALNDILKNFAAAREAGFGAVEAFTGLGSRGMGQSIADARKNSGAHLKEIRKEIDELEQKKARNIQSAGGDNAKALQGEIDALVKKRNYYIQLNADVAAEESKGIYGNEGRRSTQSLAGYKGKDPKEEKGAKAADVFTPLVRQIDEQTAALAAEAATTDRLSAAQKLALKVMTDLQGGYLKLTDTQKRALAGKLDGLLANDDLNRSTEEAARAEKEYAEAVKAALDPLEKRAVEMERANENYGKSEAEIEKNTVAILEEARAVAAANGAWEGHLSFLDREIEARSRIAKASEDSRINDLLLPTSDTRIAQQQKDMAILAQWFERNQDKEAQYIEAVQARLGITTEKVAEVNDAARQLGMTFSSAFEDAIVEGKETSEVLAALAKDIERIVVRKSITEPLGNAISGLFNKVDIGSVFKDLLPSYDVGTPYVPSDGPAYLHKGEAVVPAEFNRGSGGSTAPVSVSITNHIDSRTDLATIAAMMARTKQDTLAAVSNAQRRGG